MRPLALITIVNVLLTAVLMGRVAVVSAEMTKLQEIVEKALELKTVPLPLSPVSTQ